MQNNPTYENNSAEVGSGADAFEMYQSGASIEEINAKFFPSDSGSDSGNSGDIISAGSGDSTENANDDLTIPHDGAMRASTPTEQGSPEGFEDSLGAEADRRGRRSLQGEGVEENGESGGNQPSGASGSGDSDDGADNDSADSSDDALNNSGDAGERKFTQAELDSFIGRARHKERDARDRLQKDHDSLLSDIAGYFGVGTDRARDVLKDEMYKREAEEKGVDDSDTYARARRAEIELEQFKQNIEAEKRQRYVNGFLSDVERQLGDFCKSNPDVDVVKVSNDENFNNLLKDLYVNPVTRDRCVEIAMGAFGLKGQGGGVLNPSAVQSTLGKESNSGGSSGVDSSDADAKRAAAIEANRKRASESASTVQSGLKSQSIDYSKMTAKDFEELGKRAAKGEIIVPSV